MKFRWLVVTMVFISAASNFCRGGARAEFYRNAPLMAKQVHPLECKASSCVNAWMPYTEIVQPIPEWARPDHGRRELAQSQQYQ